MSFQVSCAMPASLKMSLWLMCLSLLAPCLQIPSTYAAESVAEQYQKIAKQTLEGLRKDGIKSVGVLKFAVRVGDGQFPGNVGLLNTRLAERLELALVIANPAHQSQLDKQVGVIRNASATAASIAGATHASEAGRKLLFSKAYPLAWELGGKTSVVPDALIVGVAQVHPNLRNMDIELLQIRRSDLQLRPLANLTVKTELDDLLEGGESFTTRGLFDDGQVTDSEKSVELVAQQAVAIRNKSKSDGSPTEAKHPLAPGSGAPVKLEIFYNGVSQPLEFREGSAFVKEPLEGQKISFAVTRQEASKTRYGVLLQVNGENTLYRERKSNLKSSLWILEPAAKLFGVYGFQMSSGARQDFRVLSKRESELRAIDYGRDVGLIALVVFEEAKGTPSALTDDALDLAVQSHASLPDATAPSRGQLGKSLFDQLLAQDSTRGLIAEGEQTKSAVNSVTFERNPVPVMAASIHYYKP